MFWRAKMNILSAKKNQYEFRGSATVCDLWRFFLFPTFAENIIKYLQVLINLAETNKHHVSSHIYTRTVNVNCLPNLLMRS